MTSALMLVLLQSGWALTQSPPRQVGRVYWELIPQTEIWVRLIPEDPGGKPPLLNLVFHAFFPGRSDPPLHWHEYGLHSERRGSRHGAFNRAIGGHGSDRDG